MCLLKLYNLNSLHVSQLNLQSQLGGVHMFYLQMLRVPHLCFHFALSYMAKPEKWLFTHPHTLSAHTLLNTKTNYHHPIVVIQCDHYASGVLQTAKYLFYQDLVLLL